MEPPLEHVAAAPQSPPEAYTVPQAHPIASPSPLAAPDVTTRPDTDRQIVLSEHGDDATLSLLLLQFI